LLSEEPMPYSSRAATGKLTAPLTVVLFL